MVVARSWGEPSEIPRSEPALMTFHCCQKQAMKNCLACGSRSSPKSNCICIISPKQ